MDLRTGDVVRLRGGGPALTVDRYGFDGVAEVHWFDGRSVKRDSFRSRALKPTVATRTLMLGRLVSKLWAVGDYIRLRLWRIVRHAIAARPSLASPSLRASFVDPKAPRDDLSCAAWMAAEENRLWLNERLRGPFRSTVPEGARVTIVSHGTYFDPKAEHTIVRLAAGWKRSA